MNLDQLLPSDPETADRAGLDAIATRVVEIRAWLDKVDVRVCRRVAELSTGHSAADPRTAGREDAASTIAAGGRRSHRDARRVAGRAEVCDRLPQVEAALGAGEISGEHIDGIHNAINRLRPDAPGQLDTVAEDLLAAAREQSPETFSRTAARLIESTFDADRREQDAIDRLDKQRRQSKVRSWIDHVTGMWKLHAEVDPETGAKLQHALEARLATITSREANSGIPLDRLRVDALVELVTAQHRDEPRIPEVYVHIDLETLLQGLHEHSLCELADGIPIPVETVRRLCCDADIIPVVLGSDGTVLDCGRQRRQPNRQQRRALRAMYRTCGHPHCDVAFEQCEIHHVVFWERGGLTDLDNLLPLCSRHHHLVHEGRWRLTMNSNRVITLVRPDGAVVFSGPTHDRSRREVVSELNASESDSGTESVGIGGPPGAGDRGTTHRSGAPPGNPTRPAAA